jgi:signal transduction histidine kinase
LHFLRFHRSFVALDHVFEHEGGRDSRQIRSRAEASQEIKRYLNSADEELRRVAHITQQTLGFYRNNSQPVVLAIADVIQDVLTIYERKCQYKALNIEQRIEPNLTLTAVQGELKQTLSNLIANAIDASKGGAR